MKTEVHNLATDETLSYTLPPREAVIAAYAQSRGDFNTWDYEKRYGKLVEKGRWTVTIVEHLYNLTLEGWAAEELGSVQDFGWYGLLLFGDDPITAEYDDSSEKVAAAILTEDSQGFVYADTFKTKKAAKEQWSKIEDEYEEFAKEAEEAEEEEEEESDW